MFKLFEDVYGGGGKIYIFRGVFKFDLFYFLYVYFGISNSILLKGIGIVLLNE
jgi:hypothetical protein